MGRSGRMLVGAVMATAIVIGGLSMPAGAHVTNDFTHLWNQHLKPLLATPGVINDPANPVDWTKLKGVPAGFADGLDNGVDKAGFGLKRGIVIGGGLEFAVDAVTVQRRVTGTCPAGTAIQSIAQSGAVTCAPGPSVLTGVRDDTGLICNDWCVEGVIELPKGIWLVSAKIVLTQVGGEDLSVDCRLVTYVPSTLDTSEVNIPASSFTQATLNVQGVASLGAAEEVGVTCRDSNIGDVYGSLLRISALSVGSYGSLTVQGS